MTLGPSVMLATAALQRRVDGLAGRPQGSSAGRGRLVRWADDLDLPAPVRRAGAPGAVVSTVFLVWLGPGVAALVAMSVAVVAVVRLRGAPARREKEAGAALPDVLESVARRLRAGASLAQALADVEPLDQGLAASWATLVTGVRTVGVAFALDRWRAGVSGEIRLAGAALAVAATTGGSPARAVDGVAATLRARAAVADEARALATQARASAAVIAAAPVVFALLSAGTDPQTAAFLGSPLGLVVVAGGLLLDGLGTWWMARLCRPRPDPEGDVPDVVDLFAVAVTAGLNVRLATEAVAALLPAGGAGDVLQATLDRVAAGQRLADAFEDVVGDFEGPAAALRPLVTVLVDAERYGTALGSSLARVADEARRRRQRQAEVAARRLPVQLLFPLVICVLPAFGLLTVAPLIAGGLRAIQP